MSQSILDRGRLLPFRITSVALRYHDSNRAPLTETLMSEPNPYQPPVETESTPPWWQRLFSPGRAHERYVAERFARGHAIICNGISLFIDPNDASSLYAATPSQRVDADRMELICEEACQAVKLFASDFPRVSRFMRHRRLQIRIIESYASKQGRFVHEFGTDLVCTELIDEPLAQ
ncbi:MAG: hypothetical protein AAFV88_07205 [Planctomycetota bacterium]